MFCVENRVINLNFKINFQLAISNTTERNWRGIFIALLVIIIVLALIVTSIILLTPPDDGPRIKGRRLEIADLLRPELQPKVKFNGSWISGKCMHFNSVPRLAF